MFRYILCDLTVYRRKPAWTDRILHMASPATVVEFLKYRSHAEITMSDHRPVSADCNIHVRLSMFTDLISSFPQANMEICPEILIFRSRSST